MAKIVFERYTYSVLINLKPCHYW